MPNLHQFGAVDILISNTGCLVMKWIQILACSLLASLHLMAAEEPEPERVLVFSKTTSYRHSSIPAGITAVKQLGVKDGFAVDATEDAAVFTPENLAKYRCVVFLSTTGEVFTPPQRQAFQDYIQSGGGFAGIHAASYTEISWPWFVRLVGGVFTDHSAYTKATLEVCDCPHSSTSFLPKRFERTDEWYNFTKLSPRTTKLLNVDESTYKGGKHGKDHPIAWCQEFDGGRSWYTAGGHADANFAEPDFLKHIAEGIKWAGHLGDKKHHLDPKKRKPADDHFDTEEISSGLEDPMEIAALPDGRILIIERVGGLKLYTPGQGTVKLTRLPVKAMLPGQPDIGWYDGGAIGIAVDPDFGTKNDFIYIYRSPLDKPCIQLTRYRFDGKVISEPVVIIEVPDDRGDKSCHVGGSVCFGKDRQLYLSCGDFTNAWEYDGFTGIDERPGRFKADAQRTAGNTNDLRGAILRIRINEKGDAYSIPEGNLFPPGTAKTRPEIFVKGCRNPWRIGYDSRTGAIAWGDVGPDANSSSPSRGTIGYDLVGYAEKAGYYGWPYFRGDGYYVDYDFATGKSGRNYADGIVNESPNNTGLRELPPVQKALMWYPYGQSPLFPEMGSGGRNACVSVVYNQEGRPNSFPAWFDRVLINHDWMRCQLKLIKLDEQNRLESIQDFLPRLGLMHPSDMCQDAQGNLYVLDYGGEWLHNKNGRLFKISFSGWNRKPRINLDTAERFASLSTEHSFKAQASDPEGTAITATWDFGDGQTASGLDTSHRYAKIGRYTVCLKVTDTDGVSNSRSLVVNAGNNRPEIAFTQVPKSFAWGDELSVAASAKDAEDSDLTKDIVYSAEYGFPSDQAPLHPRLPGLDPALPGTVLMVANGCIACHTTSIADAGPAFTAIAKRYKDDPERVAKLTSSLLKGSDGKKWSTHAPMPAFGHLPKADIEQLVDTILSLASARSVAFAVVNGKIKVPPQAPEGLPANAKLHLRASVSDHGAAPLRSLSASISAAVEVEKLSLLSGPVTSIPPEAAELKGQGIRVIDGTIGYTEDPKLEVLWQVQAPAEGDYSLSLELGNPVTDANRASLDIDGRKIEVAVPKTGGWRDFRKVELGKVHLAAGRHVLILRPAQSQGHLASIRNLELQRQ